MAEEIKIIVGADTSKLQASLAKAESDLKSFQTQLNSTGDAKKIDELNKKIAETQSIIGSLKTQLAPVKITADNADLVNKIAQSEKELEILKAYQSQIQLNADSSQLDAALLKAEDELKAINSQISLIQIKGDPSQIDATIKMVESELLGLKAAVVPISGDTSQIDSTVAKVQAELVNLKAALIPIAGDTSEVDAAILKVQNELINLKSVPVPINGDTTEIDAAISKVQSEIVNLKATASINGDTSQIDALIGKVENELTNLKGAVVPLTADPTQIDTTIANVSKELEGLQGQDISLKADASQFNAELQKAENELKQFQAALKKTTDLGELQTLNTKIKQTENAIASMGGAMKKVPQATGAASASITNLGRIVSDSAYGFIGIANNIQPFIDSLGYARKEAQATGTSLGKNLLSALTGPAGLSLAFGAVTTAITFAQIGFSAWTRGAQKAKEDTDAFSKSLRDAEQNALSQGIKLEALTQIITDSTKSEKERNIALSEANKILEPYGQKIDSINISVAKAKELTDAYTQSLINQAVGAKLADKIADLRLQKTELQNKASLQQAKINGIIASKSVQENKLVARQYGTSDFAAYQYATTTADLAAEQQNLIDINQEIGKTQNQINDYTKQYTTTVSDSLTLQKENANSLNSTKNAAADASKETKNYLDVIAELNKNLKDQQTLSVVFDVSTLKEQAKLVEDAITKLVTDFNFDPKNEIIINLKANLADIEQQIKDEAVLQRIRTNIENRTGLIKLPWTFDDKPVEPPSPYKITQGIRPIKIPVEVQADLKKLDGRIYSSKLQQSLFTPLTDEAKKGLDSAWQNFLAGATKTVAVGLGELLGTAISKAISGAGNFGDVFKGIFDTLSQGVKALGEQLIEIGTLALIAQSSLAQILANPFAAIAAGIALVALSTAISNLMNKKKFAVGTRYAPGGMALVGERGPELVSLPRGSQVIPAAQTASMMGAASQVEVFGVLRGQDIYFSNKKYGRTYGRTT